MTPLKFPKNHQPIKLYRNPISGHCHRVELMMAFLGLPYETIDLDMANGAHKAPDYLKINPFGQVPAIDDNGVILADSNAILIYLVKKYSDGYDWLSEDPQKAAEIQRWLSVAAGEIASGPCSVRLVKVFGVDLDYQVALDKTKSLFAILEAHLKERLFLTGAALNLADVAGYSYISHVPEGGVSLEPYPSIRAWLARIEAHPGFVPMARSPLPPRSAARSSLTESA